MSGGQGAFVLAVQEKPSVVKANYFPMRSFTLCGDGCSDGGSGSVVHCLEIKHVRVYPVLVHVGARDLVACSACTVMSEHILLDEQGNKWEKNILPYFDQLSRFH